MFRRTEGPASLTNSRRELLLDRFWHLVDRLEDNVDEFDLAGISADDVRESDIG